MFDKDRALMHEKLREHTEAIKQVMETNARQDLQLQSIEKKVDGIHDNTKSIVDLFQAANGTVKMVKWFGACLVWISGVIGAITAIYYAVTHWPDK